LADFPELDTALQSETFVEIGRAAECNANLDCLGTGDLRKDIADLQMELAECERITRRGVKGNRKERVRLQEIQDRQVEEREFPDRGAIVRKLDQKILKRREDVEDSVLRLKLVTDEVLRLRVAPQLRPQIVTFEESSTESSESVSEMGLLNAEFVDALIRQRDVAKSELATVGSRYRDLKVSCQNSQARLVDDLRVLRERLVESRKAIETLSRLEELDTSSIVLSVIGRIDESIQEMKSSLI
jgi:hypothetical protein